MTNADIQRIAQAVLRDVFPPDVVALPQSPAERLADAMFRDAGIVLGTDAARALVRAGWRAPE
jgi:hypothetical protein